MQRGAGPPGHPQPRVPHAAQHQRGQVKPRERTWAKRSRREQTLQGINPQHSRVPTSGAAPGSSQRFLLGHSSDSGRWRADFVGHSEGRPVSEGDRAPGGDLPCPHKAPHLQNRHLRATAHCSRAHPGAHHSRLQRAESWTTAGRAFGANVPPGIQQSSCSAPPAKQANIIPNAKSRTGSLGS